MQISRSKSALTYLNKSKKKKKKKTCRCISCYITYQWQNCTKNHRFAQQVMKVTVSVPIITQQSWSVQAIFDVKNNRLQALTTSLRVISTRNGTVAGIKGDKDLYPAVLDDYLQFQPPTRSGWWLNFCRPTGGAGSVRYGLGFYRWGPLAVARKIRRRASA